MPKNNPEAYEDMDMMEAPEMDTPSSDLMSALDELEAMMPKKKKAIQELRDEYEAMEDSEEDEFDMDAEYDEDEMMDDEMEDMDYEEDEDLDFLMKG